MISKKRVIELKALCKNYEKQLSSLLSELEEREKKENPSWWNYKHVSRTKRLGLMFRQEMIDSEKEMKH